MEVSDGIESAQGLAILVFLAAFTCLSWALFADGSILLFVGFLVGAAASIGLFLKAKPMEQGGR